MLIAHGDATSGYSLFVATAGCVYDMNVGGQHATAVSDRTMPAGHHRLGVAVRKTPDGRGYHAC